MPSFTAFIAPLALLLPLPTAHSADVPAVMAVSGQSDQHVRNMTPEAPTSAQAMPLRWVQFQAPSSVPVQNQVRVQQRVIIRIAPRRPARTDLRATLPQGEIPRSMTERKIGKCLSVKSIAGVMPTRDNRLLLFMRDQRIIAASLEKACSARDYYSGFYVEPSRDGKICVERDKLQSRTGARCEIRRIRQLVRSDR